MTYDKYHQLQILETLEAEPEITQADLASRVGVAVATVNWYLQKWTKKGLVKVKKIDRWRWKYLLTPQGVAEKTRLAGKYIETSFRIYRRSREEAREILEEVKAVGYDQVCIVDQGEIAEICALTCLEMGIEVVINTEDALEIPTISLNGTRLVLHFPDSV
jgi:DNA-binding MarR family transcriptional regulator